ncbi:hypothetical protein PSTG_15819 [Puccinia striiformis f. sp. tritici PST-78]|uniref:DUF659 domain-containing protein n=1 Tax=Puccinia striiformis f. sp. tritici PST-78 TaxID=1165861 RepID=A0A0L0UVG4_9BASI|nr:hypothetical protein PSTG_15819 [Puccinia striiformis f. sp. tritici PST-78]
MGNQKKRRKQTKSPLSSGSDSPGGSKEPTRRERNRAPVTLNDNSDVKHLPSVNTTAPGSASKLSKVMLTGEQELKKARRVHANQQSQCYPYFHPPILSDTKDKNGRLMLAYAGKTQACCQLYLASCTKKQREANTNQKLADMGVSGTGDIDPREVPQLCAVWCAQAARPFASLGELSHLGIIHATDVKNSPNRRTVSNDIAKLYTAVQESLIESFKHHKGAMYLGAVIYRLVEEEEGGFHLEAMPLDFVRLQQSHTGVYLAETVQLIVEKFGLQDKIYGIVTDNTSNNQTMIKEIQTYRWPHFKGETTWVRCFAHILNLIAQVVLRPFGSHKRNKKTTSNFESAGNSNDDGSDEEEDCDHDSEDDDNDDNDDGSTIDDSALAAELVNDDEVELEDDDVNNLSDKDEKTLGKFRAIARKLNKSPNSKAHFVKICRDQECSKPHNISLEWQKDRKYGLSREYYINDDDIHLARDLCEVLEPFYNITLQVLIRGSAQIADVVVFIDQITSHLSTAISDKKDDYPPALRNTCRAGLQLTNKYYTLADCSPLYPLPWVFLHPSFKDKYFKLAKWKPEWIQESIRLTREMWDNEYKPSPQATNSQPVNPYPKKPHAGVLAGLISASEARGGSTPTDPLSMWLSGGLILNDEGGPLSSNHSRCGVFIQLRKGLCLFPKAST